MKRSKMKLVEFINPIKNKPIRDICLAALYYQQRYREDSKTQSIGIYLEFENRKKDISFFYIFNS